MNTTDMQLPVQVKEPSSSGKTVGVGVIKVLLVLAFVIYAFNVDYSPATGGLDPSWQYIINYGFDQRLEFSFTSGPLGFINYPMNIGVNLEIAILIRLIFWLAISAWFGFTVFRNRFPLPNLLVFIGLVGLGNSVSFDYWVCFIGLLVLSCALYFPRRWLWMFGVVIVLSAFLALVKLSAALLMTAACVMFCAVLFWVDRRKAAIATGMVVVGIPAIFTLMYLAYMPSFASMLTYLKRSIDISSGYNVAMSVSGSSTNLWLALAIGLAYMLHTGFAMKFDRNAGLMGIVYLPAVFFAFKHGFVRQDGHETIFFAVLALLFALLWLFTPFTKRTLALLSLLIPILIPFFGMPQYSTGIGNLVGIPKLVIMQELLEYDRTKTDLDRATRQFWEQYRLPAEWTGTIGQEKLGIFPWETAYAPANNLNYQPFPIIQAYSAYTAYLDSENARFLSSPATAPEFILMEWVAIDYRHALLDVPDMWRELYRWYDVKLARQKPFPLTLLKRRDQSRFQDMQPFASQTYTIGDFIEIPASDHPIIMKVHMQLTIMGKLMKLLFRVPEVTMELVGTGGTRAYRVIPETLRNPVFINALPINLHDLALLTNQAQWRSRIYGFSISGEGRAFYVEKLQVEFFQIPEITLTQVPIPEFDQLVALGEATMFDVERLSVYTPQKSNPDSGSSTVFLMIMGWALDQETGGQVGDVYAEIDGRLYATYYGLPRSDLVKRFQRPEYGNAGFYTLIQTVLLGSGEHTISIKILSNDRKGYYSSGGEVRFGIP